MAIKIAKVFLNPESSNTELIAAVKTALCVAKSVTSEEEVEIFFSTVIPPIMSRLEYHHDKEFYWLTLHIVQALNLKLEYLGHGEKKAISAYIIVLKNRAPAYGLTAEAADMILYANDN